MTLTKELTTGPPTSELLAAERAALNEAAVRGFLVRSGQRIATLSAWRIWCQATRRPCIIVAKGVKQDTVEVDGRVVEKVPAGEGGATAERIVERLERAGERVRLVADDGDEIGADRVGKGARA